MGGRGSIGPTYYPLSCRASPWPASSLFSLAPVQTQVAAGIKATLLSSSVSLNLLTAAEVCAGNPSAFQGRGCCPFWQRPGGLEDSTRGVPELRT